MQRSKQWKVVLALGLAGLPARAFAQAATTAGTPSAPHPTLEGISIVWPLTGDDDADGTVAVRYRASGASEFRTGLPLRRVPAGTSQGLMVLHHRAECTNMTFAPARRPASSREKAATSSRERTPRRALSN